MDLADEYRKDHRMFWNNPKYKPNSKICDEFWQDFLTVAHLLDILDRNRSKEDKAKPTYVEPDIYSVFNKIRQDDLLGQPYTKEFIRDIDRSIEYEFQKTYGRKTTK